MSTYGLGELRQHHLTVDGEHWAKGNRILCDFFHRHVEPPRVAASERDSSSDVAVSAVSAAC